MYDRSVPVFTHALKAMSKILDKAEADCVARKIDATVLLTDRLYPDMLNFTRQIQIAADHARRGCDRLIGAEPAAVADTETSFAELKARLAMTIDHLAGLSAEQFEGAESRSITIKVGPRDLTFSGGDFLTRWAMPNFYFHLTVAHCILRSNGVGIGKADFLGGV